MWFTHCCANRHLPWPPHKSAAIQEKLETKKLLKKTVGSDKIKLSISQLFGCISTFKKTAARLQSELEFERASLGLQAVFHFKDTFFDSLVSENQSKSTWTKETKGKLTKVLVKISDLSRGLARNFAEVRRVLQIHPNPPARLFPLGWLD